MEATAKRRLALLGAGALLAGAVTAVVRYLLTRATVAGAEPYSVAAGLGVAMPLLLAGAYPLTSVRSRGTRATLAVAEGVLGIAAGLGAVALLLGVDVVSMLAVGGGAAATYLGGVAGRALVLGRLTVEAGE